MLNLINRLTTTMNFLRIMCCQKGNIEKATLTVLLKEDDISISDESNILTVTAPEMTQFEIDGGAKYQYSIDGGKTWKDENSFENLELGQECSVCIRFAVNG